MEVGLNERMADENEPYIGGKTYGLVAEKASGSSLRIRPQTHTAASGIIVAMAIAIAADQA